MYTNQVPPDVREKKKKKKVVNHAVTWNNKYLYLYLTTVN